MKMRHFLRNIARCMLNQSTSRSFCQSSRSDCLTHVDKNGAAHMVDISSKTPTTRTAIAKGSIRVTPEIIRLLNANSLIKGDALAVARVAGIMAAKQTSTVIPLCHPIPISKAKVEFFVHAKSSSVYVTSTVSCKGETGVEMEALTACSVACLTIYDMCKAVSKSMVISNIHLVHKSGGKSDDYNAGVGK